MRSTPLYFNRELSWLTFNARVLAQSAEAAGHPLLERVKFLAIAAHNLDNFFMVRMATLLRERGRGVGDVGADGLDSEQQLKAVRERAAQFLVDLEGSWRALRPTLATAHIVVLDREDYTEAVTTFLEERFRDEIFPVLTPLAFDPGHPFPFISNRSSNLAVVIRHNTRRRFARVKVPDVLPRFIAIPASVFPSQGETFALIEDVIVSNIGRLFPGVVVESASFFRLLRDTDIVVSTEESEDLLESVDRSLKQLRHGPVTMLQVDREMPPKVLDILKDNFEVTDEVVYVGGSRMDFADWSHLATLPRPALKDPPFVSRDKWGDASSDVIFDQIRARDQLVHHPFDSFSAVEAFLEAATRDPHVIAIKMTLYRLEAHSPLIDLLVAAADGGKQVAVLVELKARFEERSNITWATRLEAAGIHVVYGMAQLKTHCKLCLVVRREGDGIQCYAHVGTGNYNRATAEIYTDLGLFTARAPLVADISDVFNYLTGYSGQSSYRSLLVGPVTLRSALTALVDREIGHARAGRPAHLIFKANAISDPDFIAQLYEACRAGVSVDLIVRGICCARPGLKGVSERMTVRSIVGRFLEHTRLYSFANGGEGEVYLGSADLMERNLSRRVEVLCPVIDQDHRRELRDLVLDAYLRDNSRAHLLRQDGTYELLTPPAGRLRFSAQDALLSLATDADEPRPAAAAAESTQPTSAR